MIEYEAPKGSAEVKVVFTLVPNGLEDQALAVVGDFNGWDPSAHPFDLGPDGVSQATIVVPAGGRYAFRYLAEHGTWLNDEAAHHYESNGMGAENSILDLTHLHGPSEGL